MRDGMRIGELAARFGLNPKTIRYYEEIGLLKRAGRSESGYRLYGKPDVERLGFIRRAKTVCRSMRSAIFSRCKRKVRRPVARYLASLTQRSRSLTSRWPN